MRLQTTFYTDVSFVGTPSFSSSVFFKATERGGGSPKMTHEYLLGRRTAMAGEASELLAESGLRQQLQPESGWR